MNPISPAITNRFINVMLLGALLGGGGSEGLDLCCEFGGTELFCIPPIFEEGGSPLEVDLFLFDLNSKALPFVQDPDDADPKDMTITSAKFQPFQFEEGDPYNKWLLMRAKKDGASASHIYDREFSGDFSLSLDVAIEDDAEGLMDDVSVAFLGMQGQGPAEGSPALLQMEARWDADVDGLVISALDDGGPLGEPVALPGTRFVTFSMVWNDGQRYLSAYGAGEGDFYYEDVAPMPNEAFKLGLGARDLGKKARMYFNNLTVRVDNGNSGTGEAAPAVYASIALDAIDVAALYADGFDGFQEPNPGQAKVYLELAEPYLEAAQQALEDAQNGQGPEGKITYSLHPTTQVKLATRSLKRSVKTTGKGIKLGTKLVKKSSSKTNGLKKRIDRARWHATLVRAQLFGFKSKSIGKYYKTMNIFDNINFFVP